MAMAAVLKVGLCVVWLATIPSAADGDFVVADAVFRGPYVGVVRMIQEISDENDGADETKVIVDLLHANDTNKQTDKHMWHVEHDPISGTSCAATNKHYAPFGITKAQNYTTYCSGTTPDFCELGDISTKSSLTSLGRGPLAYTVPLLPVVGPLTVIGHSVNIHQEEMIKVREACANIVLNTRMTKAKLVEVNVKKPETLSADDMMKTRIAMASKLGIPVSKIQTAVRLDVLGTGCMKMPFLIFGRGTYCDDALEELRNGKVDIGMLTPVGCLVDGETVSQPEETKKSSKVKRSVYDKGCQQRDGAPVSCKSGAADVYPIGLLILATLLGSVQHIYSSIA